MHARCFYLKSPNRKFFTESLHTLPMLATSLYSSSSGSICGSPQRKAGICRTQEGREGTWPGQGSQRGPGAAAGWSRAAFRQQWLWVWHRRRRLLGASAWSEKTSSRSAGRHHDISVKGLFFFFLKKQNIAPCMLLILFFSHSWGCFWNDLMKRRFLVGKQFKEASVMSMMQNNSQNTRNLKDEEEPGVFSPSRSPQPPGQRKERSTQFYFYLFKSKMSTFYDIIMES